MSEDSQVPSASDIAAVFRAGELERRRKRQEALLRNEAALSLEPLTEGDKVAHNLAVKKIGEQRALYNESVERVEAEYWEERAAKAQRRALDSERFAAKASRDAKWWSIAAIVISTAAILLTSWRLYHGV